MPIREYECLNCGNVEEQLERNSYGPANGYEPPLCEACCSGDAMVQKRYSTSVAHFHGGPGGWTKPSPAAKRIVNPDNVGIKVYEQ